MTTILREQKIINLLDKIYKLLKQIEPLPSKSDIEWNGPYLIFRRKERYPSHFLFYNNCLYCSITIRWHTYSMSWEVGTKEIKYDNSCGAGEYPNDEYLWSDALCQIYHRFKSAIKNSVRYNRHVAKYLPFTCRTGKILRKYTWEKNVKSIIPMTKIMRLEKLLEKAKQIPLLSKMSLKIYLETVGIAKDAVFRDSRKLDLVEKYKRRADTRHGGMLDLPLDDERAFEKWYHSGSWSGSHPWEIVFGHPHGIELAVHHDKDGWKYAFWVDSIYWYGTAAHMAIVLAEKNIPFEFYRAEEVVNTLKGIDFLEVGPFYGMISFDELKENRPDSINSIQWDDIPQIIVKGA